MQFSVLIAKPPAKCCTPHHDWKPFSHRWVPEERWLPVKDRVVGNRYIVATVGQFDINHCCDKQRQHALFVKMKCDSTEWQALHRSQHTSHYNPIAPGRNLPEQPNLLDSPSFVLALWTCHSLQSQSWTRHNTAMIEENILKHIKSSNRRKIEGKEMRITCPKVELWSLRRPCWHSGCVVVCRQGSTWQFRGQVMK